MAGGPQEGKGSKDGISAIGRNMGESQELNVGGTSPKITYNVPIFMTLKRGTWNGRLI